MANPKSLSTELAAAAVPVWNVETLRVHITALIDSLDERMCERLDAADRAVSKAELASEKRFEAVNEFRASLADQQRTLFPRAEAEAIFKALEGKLESELQALDAKIDLALKTLSDRIAEVAKIQNSALAIRAGERQGWQYAVAVGGVLIFLLGVGGLILGYMRAH